MTRARLAIALVAATLVAGCIIVPTPPIAIDGIPEAKVAALKSGLTTRADVLMAFGDPTLRMADDRYFVYEWSEVHWVGAVGGPGAGYPFEISDAHRLAIEFSADGRVVRHQLFARARKRTLEEDFDAWLRGRAPS